MHIKYFKDNKILIIYVNNINIKKLYNDVKFHTNIGNNYLVI